MKKIDVESMKAEFKRIHDNLTDYRRKGMAPKQEYNEAYECGQALPCPYGFWAGSIHILSMGCYAVLADRRQDYCDRYSAIVVRLVDGRAVRATTSRIWSDVLECYWHLYCCTADTPRVADLVLSAAARAESPCRRNPGDLPRRPSDPFLCGLHLLRHAAQIVSEKLNISPLPYHDKDPLEEALRIASDSGEHRRLVQLIARTPLI